MVVKYSLDHSIHLVDISWKVKTCTAPFFNIIVCKEIVESEMAGIVRHIVHTGVREVRKTLASFNLDMVISEMTISMNAEKVANIPRFPSLEPKPAAAR